MIDVNLYKNALDTGDRKKIIAAGRDMVGAAGKLPLPADKPNVNATSGQDNSIEKNQWQGAFNKQALHLTRTADAYNEASGSAAAAAALELVARLQALESSDACLNEIARIEAGDGFGTGGGFPAPGEPPWVARLEAKLDKLLAK